jgi:hypothetical protein
MENRDIQMVKRQYHWKSLFESTFQLLTRWVNSTSAPSLGMLIKSLFTVHTTLEVSSSHPVTSLRLQSMSEKFLARLAQAIPCHWEFIARLLGESESEICQAVSRSESNICEQAYQVLWGWKRKRIENVETFKELVSAVHCVKQHAGDGTLDEAVKLLTT